MPTTKLGLFDLLSSYFVVGVDLGDFGNIANTLEVVSLESAFDETGSVIWGRAKFGGENPNRGNGWWNFNDIEVAFRLTAARAGSGDLQGAINTIGGDLQALCNTFGAAPGGVNPSDYPSTRFQLELLFTSATLHLPVLVGATLDEATGRLVRDPTHPDVKLIFPRLLLAITQGDQVYSSVNANLLSWGAQGVDDAADLAIGTALEMQPPYAMRKDSDAFGFGFRKAVIDMSNQRTPPDILAKFGFGDDFQGVYLPEVRVFIAPDGLKGWAIGAATRDFIIDTRGPVTVSGDFELDVIHVGAPLQVSARFYDADGREYEVFFRDQPSPTSRTLSVSLPPDATLVLDVLSGMPPYNLLVNGTGGVSIVPVPGKLMRRAVTTSVAGQITVGITDNSPGAAQSFTLTIDVNPRAAALPPPPIPTSMPVTLTPVSGDPGYSIVLVTQSDSTATVRISPPDAIGTVTLSTTQGGSTSSAPGTPSGGLLEIPVPSAAAAGDKVEIVVDWSTSAGTRVLHAYFQYDHPDDQEMEVSQHYEDNAANTAVTEFGSGSSTPQPLKGSAELDRFAKEMPAGVTVSLVGQASYEPPYPNTEYNQALSERRAEILRRLLVDEASGSAPVWSASGAGNAAAVAAYAADPVGYDAAHYWRVDASYATPATSGTATARLERPAVPAPRPEGGVADPPPEGTAGRPSFIRYIRAMVRIAQDSFVAFELRGEVDFETAAEQGLSAVFSDPANGSSLPAGTTAPVLATQNLPGNPNPQDGIVDYSLQIVRDEATGQWRFALTLAAGAGDKDGLLRWDGATSYWRDVLGMFTVLTPLLSGTNANAGAGGAIVAVAVVSSTALILPAVDVVHVPQLTLYGGELIVHAQAGAGDAWLLLDLETALDIQLQIGGVTLISTPPGSPIKVRYKAVGFRLDFGLDPNAPVFWPVFDSSRGYTLDIPNPGTLSVPPPLDNVLQVLATRIARTNPLNLELEVGLKADLGVVKVDAVGVRIPIDPPGIPSLTALGVSVDIPQTLTGSGTLRFTDSGGFMGSVDLMLTPIKLRVAASVAVEPVTEGAQTATSIFFAIAVEFPAPILLGASGLGIYGLNGLFGMHRRRLEDPNQKVPALHWFDVVAGGDPGSVTAWGPKIGQWAIGIGAVLGTVEGGFVFNLKGMMVLELPGPRFLIFMKANLLIPRPDTEGPTSAGILATIDLDFAKGRIQIGLQFDYEIPSLIELHVPVDVFFNTNDPADFRLDLGTFSSPASVVVLGIWHATGYLMIHGKGIGPGWPGPGGQLNGFSIALGYGVSWTWGDVGSGLYLKAWSDLHVGVAFSPFRIAGTLSVGGALHLWIVSIEVSATLSAEAPPISIHGEICGKVDFFFFSVKGCVSFHLGSSAPFPEPPALVRGVVLMSRSPALLPGSGSDRPIDGSLGNAVLFPGGGTLPVVPIDSIPVIQLEFPPQVAAGYVTNIGSSPGNPATLPASGWSRRGTLQYRYVLKSVTLSPALMLEPGVEAPVVWRTRTDGPSGDDSSLDLALLDWDPVPWSRALMRSEFLQGQVKDRWMRICQVSAPPAHVLWTFQDQNLGPRSNGWNLDGVPWPDPPETKRTVPVETEMKVTEPWRSGDPALDAWFAIEPATVVEPCGGRGTPSTEPTPAPTTTASTALVRTHVERTPVSASSSLRTRSGSRLSPGRLVPTSSAREGELSAQSEVNSRVLKGPYIPQYLLPVTNNPVTDKLIKKLMDLNGYVPPTLSDIVRLDPGELKFLAILVLVPMTVLRENRLVVRALDSDNMILAEVPVLGTVVHSLTDLPARWTDSKGPWAERVIPIYNCLQSHTSKQNMSLLCFVMELPENTHKVDIGLVPPKKGAETLPPPSYLLGVVEALLKGEADRWEIESSESTSDLDTLQELLGSDPASRALLMPGTTYTLKVDYEAEGKAVSGDGASPLDSFSVQYQFETDNAAPARLDPWLLAMTPTQDEQFHFYEEALTLAFSSDDVLQLWAANGHALNGVVRAASFVSDTLPLSSLAPLPGSVLTPFEETLVEVLSSPDVNAKCIDLHIQTRHGQSVMAFELEPLTDYIFDIEASPAPAAPSPNQKQPLFRRGFTTSRYSTMAAFAEQIRTAYLGHRPVDAGTRSLLLSAPGAPTESQLEQLVREIGLGGLKPVSQPRATVLWEVISGVVQPVAILLETPEPVWRTRLEPDQVIPDEALPLESYWTLVRKLWMDLLEQGTARVQRYLVAPSGIRTLVVLKSGSRNTTVTLALRRQTHALIDPIPTTTLTVLSVTLVKAPWEDAP